MRRNLRSKSGVTPVLSNLLLTVLAVAAMSLAASATYVITNNMKQIIGERVIAEDVWFTPTGISLYLHNVGKTAVTMSTAYVNSTPQPSTPLTLEAKEHGWLNITYSWAAENLYHINVVTEGGTRVENYYNAP